MAGQEEKPIWSRLKPRIFVAACAVLLGSDLPGDQLANAQEQSRLITQLGNDAFQTRGTPQAVVFSPDSSRIAISESAAIGRVVRLFDVSSGKQTQILQQPGKAGWVSALVFSPDGGQLLCGDLEGVTLWDLATSTAVGKATFKESVRAVAISRDGTQWAAADRLGRIEIGSMADVSKPRKAMDSIPRRGAGGTQSNYGGHRVASLEFTPDGKRLIVAVPEKNGVIFTFDTSTGAVLKKDLESDERPRGLDVKAASGTSKIVLSPDATRVIVRSEKRLKSVDTSNGSVIWEKQPPLLRGPSAYSPDGKHLATGTPNGVLLFNAQTGEQLFTAANKGTGAKAAGWSADGSEIVVCHMDGYVRIWNATSGECVWEQPLSPALLGSKRAAWPVLASFSNDGKRIFAATIYGRSSSLAQCYDRVSGKVIWSRKPKYHYKDAAISPDGKQIILSSGPQTSGKTRLHAIDTKSGDITFVEPAANGPGLWNTIAIEFTDDSRDFYVATGIGEVIRFDAATGKQKSKILADWRTPAQREKGRPLALTTGQFSQGATFFASYYSRSFYVWETKTGKQKATHPMVNGTWVWRTLSRDGKYLAVSDGQDFSDDFGQDNLRLMDTVTGKILLEIPTDSNRALVKLFSPDGSKLFAEMARGGGMVFDVSRKVRD